MSIAVEHPAAVLTGVRPVRAMLAPRAPRTPWARNESPAPAVSAGTRRRTSGRTAVLAAVIGLLAVEAVAILPSVDSVVGIIAGSNAVWLVIAALAGIASMVAFGAVRSVILRAAAVRMPLRDAIGMSYAAGAVHATMPAGVVFSTTYTFRRLRRSGASTSVAGWCLAATGVLASATLALVGLVGVLASGAGSVGALVVEIATALLTVAALVQVVRRPAVLNGLACHGLRWVNRLRRKPAETGLATLLEQINGLRTVRPALRHWAVAAGLALANWVLDLLALAACCTAIGIHLSPASLILTYTAGMAASSLSPIPGGIGIVDGALVLGLTTAGVAAVPALAVVIAYRLLSTGAVVLLGWLSISLHRENVSAASTAGTVSNASNTTQEVVAA